MILVGTIPQANLHTQKGPHPPLSEAFEMADFAEITRNI